MHKSLILHLILFLFLLSSCDKGVEILEDQDLHIRLENDTVEVGSPVKLLADSVETVQVWLAGNRLNTDVSGSGILLFSAPNKTGVHQFTVTRDADTLARLALVTTFQDLEILSVSPAEVTGGQTVIVYARGLLEGSTTLKVDGKSVYVDSIRGQLLYFSAPDVETESLVQLVYASTNKSKELPLRIHMRPLALVDSLLDGEYEVRLSLWTSGEMTTRFMTPEPRGDGEWHTSETLFSSKSPYSTGIELCRVASASCISIERSEDSVIAEISPDGKSLERIYFFSGGGDDRPGCNRCNRTEFTINASNLPFVRRGDTIVARLAGTTAFDNAHWQNNYYDHGRGNESERWWSVMLPPPSSIIEVYFVKQ
jgi:hypothetical protein